MKTIQTSQQAGPDGTLRLEIPVDKVGHTYRVLVIFVLSLQERLPIGVSRLFVTDGTVDLVIWKASR